MIILLVLAIVVPKAVFSQCPEPDGYYPDSSYCDRYTECRDGIATQGQCPDGLLFNDHVTDLRYPCDYPADVNCGSRNKIQPAKPTANCGNQWGYFSSGDSSLCNIFYNCVDGREFQFSCPEGLAFTSHTYMCTWADQSPDCDSQAYLGFSCPAARSEAEFLEKGYARHASPRDCRKYFLCVEGSPRLQTCALGEVFNTEIGTCDEPENVLGCQNYYPPEELAAIRERKEKELLAAKKRQEEFEARKRELAQRRAG